jgi:hypothetical protein
LSANASRAPAAPSFVTVDPAAPPDPDDPPDPEAPPALPVDALVDVTEDVPPAVATIDVPDEEPGPLVDEVAEEVAPPSGVSPELNSSPPQAARAMRRMHPRSTPPLPCI